MRDNIELLAPAGSFENLKAAVQAGADAVYVGGARFGARAYADNFDEESLKRAIEFTHIHRKKIYLTLNTLLKEDEISSQLGDFLVSPYREGLDAVIVQDLGVLSFVHENFPKLKIHASTQMCVTTAYGVEALWRMGVRRVILPRELSLEEIREISGQTRAELEMFVHGAMCYSYSGQCLMSGMIGGRSGNRGRCAGPCRLPWGLREEGCFLNRPEERHLLNMKDLCTIQNMPQYLDAGVTSLKIEGRMKSPEYVAGTVEIYRKYLDRCLEDGISKEKVPRTEAGHHTARSKGAGTASESRNAAERKWKVDADDLQRLKDLYSRGSFTDGYLYRENGRSMLALDGPKERIRETDYICGLRKKYHETEKKEKIYGIVKILKHKEAVFQLKYAGTEVCVLGPVPEEAKARPLTRETVKDKFSRMGNTCYTLEKLEIFLDENVFLDIKAMNEMRRACVEKLTEKVLAESRREWPVKEDVPEQTGNPVGEDDTGELYKESLVEKKTAEESVRQSGEKIIPEEIEQNVREERPVYSALISSLSQWKPVLASPKISDIYVEEFLLTPEQIPQLAEEAAQHGKRLFLAMPHIFRKRACAAWEKNNGRLPEILRQTDGIGYLVRNPDECEYLMRHAPKPMIFDYTCWRMNHGAQAVWEQMGEGYALRTCVSPELNEKELLHSPVKGCEFIVYGKIPVMITANCLRKTTVGCSEGKSGQRVSGGESSGTLSLIDRKNTVFDVKTVCRYCYNLIYNSVPLSLNEEEDRLFRFGFGAFRYQFTTETERETAEILEGKPVAKRTRGHFYRGVE
ncbi:MAG: U32 family peptidase [Lachnospiraceae bacterium]|nr:U32 family peptidase [Lachnospiraceae bacterium]